MMERRTQLIVGLVPDELDDAQAIESVKGFEEIRLLINFQFNDRFLLTVVSIGQPELRHRVAGVPQLNQ